MKNDGQAFSDRISSARPAVFAAAAAVLVYAITLAGGFAYDFYAISKDDTHLRNPAQWTVYWTQNYNGGVDNLYRPLTSTFLAVESLFFGLDASDAWKFHLVSCLLHAACCALVAEFARRLANTRIAIIAGLLYAVHPVHVEVLGDIVGQAEMLCAIGILASLVLFLRRPLSIGRAIAVLGCFILAVLSKESGMLLPALLLALGLTVRRTDPAEKQPIQLLTIFMCFGLGAYIVIREHLVKFEWDRSFLDPVINPLVLSHGIDRLLMPIVLIGHYLQLLIVPWKLSPDYSGEAIGSIAHFVDPYLWLGLLAIAAWCAMTILAVRRRANTMLFCLLSIAITYGLIGNLVVIIGTNFAERLMYLPSVFFVILVAMGLSKLPKFSMIGVTAFLILLGSIRTVSYAHLWNDRLALYQQASRNQPGAVRIEMLLAAEQFERGDHFAAMQTILHAQQQAPNYNELWDFSAALAIRMSEFDAAEKFLKHSEALGPTLRSAGLEQKLDEARAASTQLTSQPTTQSK